MEIYGEPYVRRIHIYIYIYIDAADARLVSVGLAQARPNYTDRTTDQLHKVTYIHHMVSGGKVVLQHGRPGPFLLPLFKAVFLTLGPPPTPKEGTWGGE